MAQIPILPFVRIVPREQDFLDRKSGSPGEVFFDKDNNTLRLYNNTSVGGINLARADLVNIDNDVFKLKASDAGISASTTLADTVPSSAAPGELWLDTSTGILYIYYNDGTSNQWIQPANLQYGAGGGGGVASNSFATISVSGQSNVVADSSTDTLTLVAGTNVTITTDAVNDRITISAAGVGGASNSFTTFSVAGQNDVVAETTTDTLTLVAGTGITLTTDSATDSITITSSAGANFSDLTDATAATLSVDKIYLPAMTKLTVDNISTSAYTFDQYTGSNPTIYAIGGTTIAFDLNAVSGHPFLIQDGTGNNYDTGLVHVSSSGVVSTGASAQAKDSGTLYWKVPATISGGYRYQCQNHVAMVGSITVKNIASL